MRAPEAAYGGGMPVGLVGAPRRPPPSSTPPPPSNAGTPPPPPLVLATLESDLGGEGFGGAIELRHSTKRQIMADHI